jgi:hypothetical protein
MTETPDLADSAFGGGDRSPQPWRKRFTCPNCEAFADQWTGLIDQAHVGQNWRAVPGAWMVTICLSCEEAACWLGTRMVWPSKLLGPLPPADLPDSVKSIYEEARAVAVASPRSAAALLRVCLEELVNELEAGNDPLNAKVGKLVARGLPEPVQRAMDTLRVFGNEAGAHVGEIDLTDDRETVLALFQVLGMVVEHVITRQNQLDALYSRIPQRKLDAIVRRDAPKA